jgi:hypothetical protein
MTERQETLLRILNLMQQGMVTPEEAADLIDAIYEPAQSAPPPESTASQTNGNGSASPARGLLDQILRAVEETVRATGQAVRSVNWQQIGQSVREQTQRGLDELRKTLDELEKGDWSLGRWGKYETDLQQTMDFAIDGGQSLSIDLPGRRYPPHRRFRRGTGRSRHPPAGSLPAKRGAGQAALQPDHRADRDGRAHHRAPNWKATCARR